MELSPYIFINLTSATCCMIFLLYLFVSYFSRKNMNNMDNKIYRLMLIANLAQVVLYVLFYTSDIITVLSGNNNLYPVVLFFSKLAPLAMIAWAAFLFLYLITLLNQHNEKFIEYTQNNWKKIISLVFFILGIISILHLLEKTEIILSTGMEPKLLLVMNISLDTLVLLDIIIIITCRKKFGKRKGLPFFMIIPLSLISITLGFTGVPIAILHVIATATNHLMYHTIENPDLKMINQLQLAKDQAEKSSKAKSDFLSSMSHEIRTPLNAIVGLSQMIEESNDVEEMHSDSRDILLASQNLLEIVNGILDINKLDTNQMEIINENYRPKEIIDSIIKLINIKIGEKPLKLRTYFSDELPEQLYGDKDKLKQIITNLLTNAVKYTETGFVDFNITCQNNKDNCELTISVKDTGRGISAEQKEKLFTRFNRLEKDKDSDIEGTGLGLAITKSLVELLEGTITVQSILGQGSTFEVILNQKIIEYKQLEVKSTESEEVL